MSSIPLKNNSGTITLLENGLLEIKKPETTILLSKACINRVQINTEGKIVIYQPNATYAVDYSLLVDKHLIVRVDAMFNTFMSAYGDKDLADIYDRLNKLTAKLDEVVEMSPASHSSMGILHDYKTSMKMVSSQLIDMCNFNIENTQRIDEKFVEINRMIRSIQANINTVDTSPIVYEVLEEVKEMDKVDEVVEVVEVEKPATTTQPLQFDIISSIIIVLFASICLYTCAVYITNCLRTTPIEILEKIVYIVLDEHDNPYYANYDDSRYVVYSDENGTLEGL